MRIVNQKNDVWYWIAWWYSKSSASLIGCQIILLIVYLFHFQGEMVDRIEYHIGSAREFIEVAKQDTKKAREFQSKARKVSWLITHFWPTIY